ncbi:MAG: hypothetical protein L6Q33_11895 [Bacteriovoracaceae bacterium]|jgi:hypothetical protein|nr:hypothetical protein [Bacteriovoracaceae bacterium]
MKNMSKSLSPVLFQVISMTCVAILTTYSASLSAKNYLTLPQGRSTFGYKYVVTDDITHKLDPNGKKESYSIREDVNSIQLEQVGNVFKSYFEILKSLSPEAYNAFSFGEYSVEASGSVKAQGIGMGHGFTHRLTGYFALPLYKAQSTVNLKQTKFSNIQAVKDALQGSTPNGTTESFMKQFTEQLPEASGEVLQSLVTNYYGYKPIGKWKKDSPGDMEVGFIYNLANEFHYGTAMSFGTILPTGSVDDPDNLQDISSGDGQTDFFIENLSGVTLIEGRLDFDVRTRYTHQVASEKYLRIPENETFPLSAKKAYIQEKLGDKIEADLVLTATYFDHFKNDLSLMYTKKFKDEYTLDNSTAKSYLEKNTDSDSLWVKAGLKFSTIDLFKANKFWIPLDIGTSVQTLISGRNTPDYTRIDIDFRLYF